MWQIVMLSFTIYIPVIYIYIYIYKYIIAYNIISIFQYHTNSHHIFWSLFVPKPWTVGRFRYMRWRGYGGSGTWFTISQDSLHQRLLPNGRCCPWPPAKQGCWTFKINMTPKQYEHCTRKVVSGIFVTGIKMREFLSCCRIVQQMSTGWDYYHTRILPSIDISQAEYW